MRPSFLVALLLLAGCGGGDVLTRHDLSGDWKAQFTIPGAAFGFTLSQVGDSVSGPGTYAIEAGRNGTLDVAGRYDPPDVRLKIVYDYGPRRDFMGQVVDRRMSGTVTDSLGHTWEMVLVKQ